MDLGFSMCQTRRMKRFSQAFFLCFLSTITCFSTSFADTKTAPVAEELAEELVDELQRLRQMSQRLDLALPNQPKQMATNEPAPEFAAEFVEDEISVGQAAPVRIGRRIDAQGEDLRPLQKDDLQLESTSLETLENRPFETETRYQRRRERSR